MLVRNLVTGSSPAVLHRNGRPPEWLERWDRIVAQFFQEIHEPCDPCPELTILTWNNRPAKSLLERCLDARRVPYVILGREVVDWQPLVKPSLTAEALRRVESDYVLAVDADDVLIVSCPRTILETFRSFQCEMLFSAEKNSYPKVPSLTEFERSIAETKYRHLNSGAWIGKTEACRRFFDDCANEDNSDILAAHPAKHIVRDDQGVTRKTFRRHYPAAVLDYHCRIFQSLFKVRAEGELLIRTERNSSV
jgi:hypothetical protein